MNNLERGAAAVAIAAFIFGAGVAWDSLSNRIDRVDEKIGAIQKTLGSNACNAILARELTAIDKGRADIRKELQGMSNEYGCAPTHAVVVVPNLSEENAVSDAASMNVTAYDSHLGAQLNAVDTALNKSR